MHSRKIWFRGLAAFGLCVGLTGFGAAQPKAEDAPKKTEAPKDLPKAEPKKETSTATPIPAGVPVAAVTDDRFRQALAENRQQTSNVAPNMFADLLGGKPVLSFLTTTQTILVPTTTFITVPVLDSGGNPVTGPNDQPLFETIPVTTLTPEQRRQVTRYLVPAAGGTVGRIKASEDNNPLPRDRVLFNYDYFNNTPLTNGGWNVNRFQFGFEKTFFEQMASLEVRLPFAGTLDNNIVPGLPNNRTELGNLRLTAKALAFRGDSVAFGGGLAVTLPTADDTVLYSGPNSELVRFKNQSVALEPFVSTLLTPTERLFAQAWASMAFDPWGSRVQANPYGLLGAANLPRYHDRTIMSLDAQVGYWLTRNPDGFVRGLAPFAELHYNATVSAGTTAVNPDGFSYGSFNGNLNELNASAGVVVDLRNNMNVALGAVVPLRDAPNRTFDYQIGLRVNWFFGPTAENRDKYYAANFGN